MSLKELKAELVNDKVYQALQTMVASISKSLNPERILQEAATLHASRESTKLWKLKMAPVPIYQAITIDLSNRARLTAVRASVSRESALLDVAVSKTKKHILSVYRDYFSEMSNQPTRAAALEKLVAPAVSQAEDLRSCLELLDAYLKDIDQASYGLGHVVNILKLMIERKDQIV